VNVYLYKETLRRRANTDLRVELGTVVAQRHGVVVHLVPIIQQRTKLPPREAIQLRVHCARGQHHASTTPQVRRLASAQTNIYFTYLNKKKQNKNHHCELEGGRLPCEMGLSLGVG
jgi:hypothetical protein